MATPRSYSTDEANRVAASDVPLLSTDEANGVAGFCVPLPSCALTQPTIVGLY